MTCNSFRLLQVFNRHFKLKKEACKTGKKWETRERRWKNRKTEREKKKNRKIEGV